MYLYSFSPNTNSTPFYPKGACLFTTRLFGSTANSFPSMYPLVIADSRRRKRRLDAFIIKVRLGRVNNYHGYLPPLGDDVSIPGPIDWCRYIEMILLCLCCHCDFIFIFLRARIVSKVINKTNGYLSQIFASSCMPKLNNAREGRG